MRIALSFLAGIAGAQPGAAAERPAGRDLISAPRSLIGRTITIPDVSCIDDSAGGFACVKVVAGRAIRINSSALGSATSATVGTRLITACRGAERVTSPACRFEVEITPTAAVDEATSRALGDLPATLFISPLIEMRAAR